MCKVILDNDVVAKITIYDLMDELVSVLEMPRENLGVLGTLIFVLSPKRLHSAKDGGSTAHERLQAFAQSARVLEPTEEEGRLAALFEDVAQEIGVDLDVGESQLAAIAVSRRVDRLCTGDKRAISALESLREKLTELRMLDGKVLPLEALVLSMLERFGHDPMRLSICGSKGTDLALELCFQCHNTLGQESETRIGLESYLASVARKASHLYRGINACS